MTFPGEWPVKWRPSSPFEHLSELGSESFAESLSFFPAVGQDPVGPEHYLDLIRRAREAVAVPVIASLNGTTDHGWTSFARLVAAGAGVVQICGSMSLRKVAKPEAFERANYVRILQSYRSPYQA